MSNRKYERPATRRDAFISRLRRFRRDASIAGFCVAVALATHTVFQVIRWTERRRIAQGETLLLDEMIGPAPKQTFPNRPWVAADLSPNPGKSQKARHMKLETYPTPEYPFAYKVPPISGNTINGLGETTPRRPDHIFFGDSYRRAWGKLDWYLQVMEPVNIHRTIVTTFWQDRRRMGPVARQVTEQGNPEETAARIKAVARQHGAALVGITQLSDNLRYADFDLPFTYAVSVAVPMDREAMLHTPTNHSGLEIQRVYKDVNRVAIEVAEHIRALGFPARASTNLSPDSAEVLHVPTAIQAGLGQLGKHGSLITAEHGSNVRLATVLTDLPLAVDPPRDIGVEDFCATCKVCTTNCPPHAIFETKQMVRGEEKWFVNFDKCAPYFAKTEGCGICIEVCPWSEPGRGLVMMDKLLGLRTAE